MTEEPSISRLERLEQEGLAIYLRPSAPDWFVPDERGDLILRRYLATQDATAAAADYAARFGVEASRARRQVEQFLGRLAEPPAAPYAGRAEHLTLDRLGECWLHVTNRCNASCGHCMFACSPETGEQLDAAAARDVLDEALGLGCRLFYFTGGEPTLYEPLPALCERILHEPEAHVVVLTNGRPADELTRRMRDWPRDRVHFQVSAEGGERSHDALRGAGSHARMKRDVHRLREAGFAVTLAMTVCRGNVDEMPSLVRLAQELDARNVHYMWLFRRGKAGREQFAPPERIWPRLREAAEAAAERDVEIDNVEILRSQVFSLPGTRFDLSNAGWQSLAIGPDGRVYPSPALIGDDAAACGHAADALERVRRTSPRLEELRRASLVDSPAYLANPLRFLVGGGDVDHSFAAGRDFTGHDPYVEVQNRLALWLIAREARRFAGGEAPHLRLRMGEYLHECGEDGDGVMFTHSNCVLSLPGRDGHSLVREFYRTAAEEVQEDIVNPVHYVDTDISFVPEAARVRSYGCGSPVADAGLAPGETVVDLGCGAGLECFLAARQVGPDGRVIGVDMLTAMLDRARSASGEVSERLGYANVEFREGLLEALPLPDGTADVVISNCVINLSPHKRQAFAEVFRVLKPGGRLVISDVASQDDIPLAIQYNEKLRGECLGGAFRVDRLLGLLSDVGFRQVTILKRLPYREVRGHLFHSLTYTAARPEAGTRSVLYRGPFAAVLDEDGRLVRRGEAAELPWRDGEPPTGGVFVLDESGNVTNVEHETTCGCFQAPEAAASSCCPSTDAAESAGGACGCDEQAPAAGRHAADCMVCGAPLTYLPNERDEKCHYCGRERPATAVCENGHFVCDACHSEDALTAIRRMLLESDETDMAAMLAGAQRHPAVPMHGPEHHALVPAIIVAAYRNAGGEAGEPELDAALRRGSTLAGGSCAFFGACSGAVGLGIGLAVLLGATPYEGRKRGLLQRATSEALSEIGALDAPRCCQRDCWIALRKAAEISREVLGVRLTADEPLVCTQHRTNRECIGTSCPLWPGRKGASERTRAEKGGVR